MNSIYRHRLSDQYNFVSFLHSTLNYLFAYLVLYSSVTLSILCIFCLFVAYLWIFVHIYLVHGTCLIKNTKGYNFEKPIHPSPPGLPLGHRTVIKITTEVISEVVEVMGDAENIGS